MLAAKEWSPHEMTVFSGGLREGNMGVNPKIGVFPPKSWILIGLEPLFSPSILGVKSLFLVQHPYDEIIWPQNHVLTFLALVHRRLISSISRAKDVVVFTRQTWVPPKWLSKKKMCDWVCIKMLGHPISFCPPGNVWSRISRTWSFKVPFFLMVCFL